jgi:TonB family protein
MTRVNPVYPPLAWDARIQGQVVVKARIDVDGSVGSVQLVSGHPMLAQSVIDAVKQWKYMPYLLNGGPVPVDTQIVVNFTLSGDPTVESKGGTVDLPSRENALAPNTSRFTAGVLGGVLSAIPTPLSASDSPPTNVPLRARTQNIAPQEIWKRVKKCTLPANALVPGNSYMTGTVEIGMFISTEGNVVDYPAREYPSVLTKLSIAALSKWKFDPNTVQGIQTRSRARAVVHFNGDGTTSVDFTRVLVKDDFGDPGSAAGSAQQPSIEPLVPRPPSAPQCQPEVQWISPREADTN